MIKAFNLYSTNQTVNPKEAWPDLSNERKISAYRRTEQPCCGGIIESSHQGGSNPALLKETNASRIAPACAAFPALPEEDLVALAADIRAKGLLEPITLTPDGLLLDGRCRWDACEREGIAPQAVVYDGDDPIGFVASKNRHRRHLDKSQMAMVIARLANLQHGSNQFELRQEEELERNRLLLNKNRTSLTRKDLAQRASVSVSYLYCVKTILTHAVPNIVAMVDAGEIVNLRHAAEVATRYDRATQATFTAGDIARIGKEIRKNWRSFQKGADKPGKSAKPKPNKMIDPPYRFMKPLTEEELDYPKRGSTVEEYDAFFQKVRAHSAVAQGHQRTAGRR